MVARKNENKWWSAPKDCEDTTLLAHERLEPYMNGDFLPTHEMIDESFDSSPLLSHENINFDESPLIEKARLSYDRRLESDMSVSSFIRSATGLQSASVKPQEQPKRSISNSPTQGICRQLPQTNLPLLTGHGIDGDFRQEVADALTDRKLSILEVRTSPIKEKGALETPDLHRRISYPGFYWENPFVDSATAARTLSSFSTQNSPRLRPETMMIDMDTESLPPLDAPIQSSIKPADEMKLDSPSERSMSLDNCSEEVLCASLARYSIESNGFSRQINEDDCTRSKALHERIRASVGNALAMVRRRQSESSYAGLPHDEDPPTSEMDLDEMFNVVDEEGAYDAIPIQLDRDLTLRLVSTPAPVPPPPLPTPRDSGNTSRSRSQVPTPGSRMSEAMASTPDNALNIAEEAAEQLQNQPRIPKVTFSPDLFKTNDDNDDGDGPFHNPWLFSRRDSVQDDKHPLLSDQLLRVDSKSARPLLNPFGKRDSVVLARERMRQRLNRTGVSS